MCEKFCPILKNFIIFIYHNTQTHTSYYSQKTKHTHANKNIFSKDLFSLPFIQLCVYTGHNFPVYYIKTIKWRKWDFSWHLWTELWLIFLKYIFVDLNTGWIHNDIPSRNTNIWVIFVFNDKICERDHMRLSGFLSGFLDLPFISN